MATGVLNSDVIVQVEAEPLAQLAGQITEELRLSGESFSAGLLHARNAGLLLIQAKGQCPHGSWLSWLKEACGLSPSTAARYMRVADRWEELEADLPRVASLPLREADRLLARPRERTGQPDPVPLSLPTSGDSWRVECADCLDWFAAQPADSMHLVFGSPPYADAWLYLEDGSDLGIARDTEAWVAWMVAVYKAALRACRGLVAFVVEGRTEGYCYSGAPVLLWADLIRAGVTTRKAPAYRRVGIPGSGGPDWLRNDYEFIVCATNGGPLPWSDNTAMGQPPQYGPGGDCTNRRRDGSRENGVGYATMEERQNMGPHRARQRAGHVYVPPEKANPGNVIDCVVGGGAMGDRLAHENEAPFPESLAEFFVRSFCPPGGVVADPFCGSGTTLAVAVACGRRGIGCDIRPSQVELTRRRLAGVPAVEAG